MLLLLVIPIWSFSLLLVAAMCLTARQGDTASSATEPAELLALRGAREDAGDARDHAAGPHGEGAPVELAA